MLDCQRLRRLKPCGCEKTWQIQLVLRSPCAHRDVGIVRPSSDKSNPAASHLVTPGTTATGDQETADVVVAEIHAQ